MHWINGTSVAQLPMCPCDRNKLLCLNATMNTGSCSASSRTFQKTRPSRGSSKVAHLRPKDPNNFLEPIEKCSVSNYKRQAPCILIMAQDFQVCSSMFFPA